MMNIDTDLELWNNGAMLKRTSRETKDLNLLAVKIVEAATMVKAKNPAAVELGRLGGLKGGRARANKLSSQRRKEIARNAAKARWAAKREG